MFFVSFQDSVELRARGDSLILWAADRCRAGGTLTQLVLSCYITAAAKLDRLKVSSQNSR